MHLPDAARALFLFLLPLPLSVAVVVAVVVVVARGGCGGIGGEGKAADEHVVVDDDGGAEAGPAAGARAVVHKEARVVDALVERVGRALALLEHAAHAERAADAAPARRDAEHDAARHVQEARGVQPRAVHRAVVQRRLAHRDDRERGPVAARQRRHGRVEVVEPRRRPAVRDHERAHVERDRQLGRRALQVQTQDVRGRAHHPQARERAHDEARGPGRLPVLRKCQARTLQPQAALVQCARHNWLVAVVQHHQRRHRQQPQQYDHKRHRCVLEGGIQGGVEKSSVQHECEKKTRAATVAILQ